MKIKLFKTEIESTMTCGANVCGQLKSNISVAGKDAVETRGRIRIEKDIQSKNEEKKRL